MMEKPREHATYLITVSNVTVLRVKKKIESTHVKKDGTALMRSFD